MQLCFATNNKNKIAEIQSMVSDAYKLRSLEDLGCFEELEETQNTLEGNSLQKAKYVHQKYNVSVFADDTGLEVFSLGMEPGVRSARYAGEERDNEANIDLLLNNLANSKNRSAQFRTIITLILSNNVYQFEGRVKGTITKERCGLKGFGYDSVFMPVGMNCTFAEMPLEQKNKISHRGLAINKLVNFLKDFEVVKQ